MFFFSEIFSARTFRKRFVSRPHPPFAEKTRGVKDPCSILITRSLYDFFFSFSFLLKSEVVVWFSYDLAKGFYIILIGYWLLRKMVTVAKGFKFLFIFLLFLLFLTKLKNKLVPVRFLCLLLTNQFLYPLNLVRNSATTGVSF